MSKKKAKSVDCKKLREAVEKFITQTDMSWSNLTEILEYYHSDGKGRTKPDTQRLRKNLGMNKRLFPKTYIHQNTALPIIRAINRDPREFGI